MPPPRPRQPNPTPGKGSRLPPRSRFARIDVQVAPRYAGAIRATAIRSAAQAALDAARARPGVSLTIVVTGDAALRRLNREFASVDAPTDVLSFESGDPGEYLGDVMISAPRARAQARRGGHPFIDEMRLLVIHGVLHLLGYDHDTPGRKKRMWAAQAKALRTVKASIEGPTQ
ncbi:MAG TPA: rRNA maturation RNase YbeY [Anaerolineae bacterium]|nr:rRNA maturation RNase YbeY [Anaerolineae bacterium]